MKRNAAELHDRALTAGGTIAYDVRRPWNYSMVVGLKDDDWWQLEFSEAAIMLLARTANISSFVGGDAPIHPASGTITADNDTSQEAGRYDCGRPSKRIKKDKFREDLSSVANNEHTANRAGRKLCADFQTGACAQTLGGGLCPRDRTLAHQCSNCLSTHHGKSGCSVTSAPFVRKPSSKGGKDKGKGKGKGKGGKARW